MRNAILSLHAVAERDGQEMIRPLGSAFVVDTTRGLALTAWHVLATFAALRQGTPNATLFVSGPDGRAAVRAARGSRDPRDVAILEIEPGFGTAIEIATDGAFMMGAAVEMVGYSFTMPWPVLGQGSGRIMPCHPRKIDPSTDLAVRSDAVLDRSSVQGYCGGPIVGSDGAALALVSWMGGDGMTFGGPGLLDLLEAVDDPACFVRVL